MAVASETEEGVVKVRTPKAEKIIRIFQKYKGKARDHALKLRNELPRFCEIIAVRISKERPYPADKKKPIVEQFIEHVDGFEKWTDKIAPLINTAKKFELPELAGQLEAAVSKMREEIKEHREAIASIE